jgi:dephospho-CoA kinase
MSAIQITGCSGAGKTTIAAVLARRGLASIDADDDPLLARTVDAAGNVVEEEPGEQTPPQCRASGQLGRRFACVGGEPRPLDMGLPRPMVFGGG